MRSIKSILMDRDGMTSNEADELIAEARKTAYSYLASGDLIRATYICEDFFGLEQDYLCQIVPF